MTLWRTTTSCWNIKTASWPAAGCTATAAAQEVYADRQGSIIWVVDAATSNIEAQYEYDSYGGLTQVAGSLQQPYGYTGREFDTESGLYYYRARAYDPTKGMFLQSDPIGFDSGQFGLYETSA